MKVVCRGWFGVHTDVRVLRDGPDDQVSDTICPECEAAGDREFELEQAQLSTNREEPMNPSSKREDAKRLLLHYLNILARDAGRAEFSGDTVVEIREIVDHVVDAAVEEVSVDDALERIDQLATRHGERIRGVEDDLTSGVQSLRDDLDRLTSELDRRASDLERRIDELRYR